MSATWIEFLTSISTLNQYSTLAVSGALAVLFGMSLRSEHKTRAGLWAFVATLLIASAEVLTVFASLNYEPSMPPSGAEGIVLARSVFTLGLLAAFRACYLALPFRIRR